MNTLQKEFTRYTSFNVLGMIGISCYILADTFFIAHGAGSSGLAALNIAIPAFTLINAVGMMIGVGGGTRFSICKAQNAAKDADLIFTHAAILGVLFSLAFLAIGMFASEPLTHLLGANEEIFNKTQTYLQTLLAFSPFFIFNNIILAFVRNDNGAGLAMAGMILGSLANIVLDYIFVFPCGLGMFGAALATGVSPIISLLILSRHHFSGKQTFRLKKGKPTPRLFPAIFSPGLSTFVGELSSGFVLFIFNLVILRISGNIGVAAYGIIANLALVVIAIFNGIAQGMQPLISKNFGLGNQQNIKKLMQYAYTVSIALSCLIYILVCVFKSPIISAFNSENNLELAMLAENGILIYFFGFWFTGISIITIACLSATKYVQSGFFLSLLRGLIAIVPSLLLFSSLLGMVGVWISFPIAECFTMIFAVFCIRKYIYHH